MGKRALELRDPIDVHVGQQLRQRRRELSLSQGNLAGGVGLTHQQLQKYEAAENRVSASKLWELSRALSISVTELFAGLEENLPSVEPSALDSAIRDFMTTDECLELAQSFARIPVGPIRNRLFDLLTAMISHAIDCPGVDQPPMAMQSGACQD